MAWTYKGWICTGSLQPNGSMINANVTDNNGRLYNRGASFASFNDFKSWVDNAPKIKG